MKKETYDKAYKVVEKIIRKENCIKYEVIEDDLQQIKEKQYIKEEEYSDFKEISELYSLRWGTLFYAFDLNERDEISILRQKIVYRSLLSNMVSNCMAIIKLAESGHEFQANIIMRNMYELCFLFLVLIIDKKRCLKYFETKNNTDEYKTWSENLKVKDLNIILKKYEEKYKPDVLPNISEWRESVYSEYSRYTHNSFDKCFYNSYSQEKETKQLYWDLWNKSNENVKFNLQSLNQLMWMTDKYFTQLFFNDEIFNKDIFFNKENKEHWIETINISLLLNELVIENTKKYRLSRK